MPSPNRSSFLRPVLWALAAATLVAGAIAGTSCRHVARFKGEAPDSEKARLQLVPELRHDLERLALHIGSRNAFGRHRQLDEARTWIFDRFAAAGLTPTYHWFEVTPERFADVGLLQQCRLANVEAVLAGHERACEVIVIGAHYDTIAHTRQWEGTDRTQFQADQPGTPGADDNASGVAALLAIARKLKTIPLQRTVRFVAFVNEEPPFFQDKEAMGSYRYARRCREACDDVRLMISLETLAVYTRENGNDKRPWTTDVFARSGGLTREGHYVAFMSNWTAGSGPIGKYYAERFSRHSVTESRSISLPFIPLLGTEVFAWSDDWSFTRHGIPAFTVTDTAFLRSGRYHTCDDTADQLSPADYQRYGDVVAALAEMIAEMANAPCLPPSS